MKFAPGQAGNIGGVEWRVVQGRKSPSDLRLDLRAVRFVPVSMSVGFLFADFYTQNERTLAIEGYLAASVAREPGARYVNFILGAQRMGWEDAAAQLQAERSAKAAA
ncbi:MAG TPA: hypothetical protein VNJ54_12635 [Plantibacter sp.]|uniref:hypothetical protein n=1 Tax=Plantibacter sp. TaxID=1871045 RepID=UPI002CF94283|nr:hypothetical protein [Plantibacter sp.]